VDGTEQSPPTESLGGEEGWYTDPFDRHQARWISEGRPTRLVRDRGVESYDPPPDEPCASTPRLIENPLCGSTSPQALHDDGHGPVAWWDGAVPAADEPKFDWGLDGYVGYELTAAARVAQRGGSRASNWLSLIALGVLIVVLVVLLVAIL